MAKSPIKTAQKTVKQAKGKAQQASKSLQKTARKTVRVSLPRCSAYLEQQHPSQIDATCTNHLTATA
jgi:hypothetical protein